MKRACWNCRYSFRFDNTCEHQKGDKGVCKKHKYKYHFKLNNK